MLIRIHSEKDTCPDRPSVSISEKGRGQEGIAAVPTAGLCDQRVLLQLMGAERRES